MIKKNISLSLTTKHNIDIMDAKRVRRRSKSITNSEFDGFSVPTRLHFYVFVI